MIRLWQLIILGCVMLLAIPNLVAQSDTLIVSDSIPASTDRKISNEIRSAEARSKKDTTKNEVLRNSSDSLDNKIVNVDEINATDSTKVKKERFKLFKSILDKTYPNPNRAAAFSLILPGSGQIYNKKYWKLPFVYGALGGLGYMANFNQDRYKTFRDAYLAVVDDDPNTVNPFPTLTESALLTRRDAANKRRQEAYVFFVLAWILNSVDAYVDAHLASFDVNEDISAHIQPVGIWTAGHSAYGLSISFSPNLHDKTTPRFKF